MKRIIAYLTGLFTHIFRNTDQNNYDSEAGLFI